LNLLALDIYGPAAVSVDTILPAAGAGVKSTVLIAARNGSHRRTLVRFLKERGHAVATTDNEEDAITLARTGDIDLVVTGHTMAGICGHELTRKLREILPDLPVILMSAGTSLLSEALLDAATALGESIVPMSGTDSGSWEVRSEAQESLAKLTQREKQVLNLITVGHANKMIARLLSISPRTVENHRARIMQKTRSRSLAALVHLSLIAGKDEKNI
jgi:DNA-binding NarL/FixJ family response regulator